MLHISFIPTEVPTKVMLEHIYNNGKTGLTSMLAVLL